MKISKSLCLLSILSLLFSVNSLSAETKGKVVQKELKAKEIQSEKTLPETARARMGMVMRNLEADKLSDATLAYWAIVERGELGGVPHSISDTARCIAVIPGVFGSNQTTGQESRGSGVVSCRTESNAWSKPAFIDISNVRRPASTESRASDLVLFLQTKDAENRLKTGRIVLGSDVSVLNNTYNTNLNIGSPDVIAYERSDDRMHLSSLNGSAINVNESMNSTYYGRSIELASLLEGRVNVPAYKSSDTFISHLPVINEPFTKSDDNA